MSSSPALILDPPRLLQVEREGQAKAEGVALPSRVGKKPGHLALAFAGEEVWAARRDLMPTEGWAAGFSAIRKVIRQVLQEGIPFLTLAREPWKRDLLSLDQRMALWTAFLAKERVGWVERGVRVQFLGGEGVSGEASEFLLETSRQTSGGRKLDIVFGLDYSGRLDLSGALKALATEARAGLLMLEGITPSLIKDRLQSGALPPVDLIIQTGSRRLPDALLWESAYAEIHFCSLLWPDFQPAHLCSALDDFSRRKRTFGGLEEWIHPGKGGS